ncbi:MAG: bifunctional serine/threonine-protein kinase/formylglycine-generating enzyme family protein [Deltaproteobacteria bacterium]|nr:bifunctional serine/threonine-protein kinase/formylglycine-generating enzyme family protein [Deltaproteobacteria bacterium]
MIEVSAERAAGQVIAERYTLVRMLGEGAFGSVWAAADNRAFGRQVALKFLLERHMSNEEVVRRFWQEGQATAALSHPNVVALLEFGEAQGIPYLVSEFVEGESLRAVLERYDALGQQVPLDAVVAIFRQACMGVAAAHAKGIVHRDLKPENIMVQNAETRALSVKVLDFGVARILGKDSSSSLGKTEMGKVIGSIQYMSPEQVLGDVRSIDRRTDQFALTAVLFEMLTLRPLFDGTNYQEIIGKILDPTRPMIGSRRPDLSAFFDPVFAQALAMHRDQRHLDVMDLLTSVEKAFDEATEHLSVRTSRKQLPVVPDLSGQWGKLSMRPPPASPKSQPPAETLDENVSPEPEPSTSNAKLGLLFLSVFLLVAVGGTFVGTRLLKRPATPANEPLQAAQEADGGAPLGWTAPPEDPTMWVTVAAPSAPVLLGHSSAVLNRGGAAPSLGMQFAGPAFRMMKREVTFGEYESWSDTHREHRVNLPVWVQSDPDVRAALPVVNVMFTSAQAYCRAIGGELPSEEQWEFAARRSSASLAPWGAGPLPEGVSAMVGAAGRLIPAGSSQVDRTPEELLGLAANAQEWTSSVFRQDNGVSQGWEHDFRTVRGLPLQEVLPPGVVVPGAFLYRNAGCAGETCSSEDRQRLEGVGFRCVKPAQT